MILMNVKIFLKSILFFGVLLVFFGVLFNACGGGGSRGSEDVCKKTPDSPLCVEEQKREEEQKQAEVQQQEKFKTAGECLKAKKAEAGLGKDDKPTRDMLEQCLALAKQNPAG